MRPSRNGRGYAALGFVKIQSERILPLRFWSIVSIRGTHLAQSFLMHKRICKILTTPSLEVDTISAISRTLTFGLFKTISWILFKIKFEPVSLQTQNHLKHKKTNIFLPTKFLRINDYEKPTQKEGRKKKATFLPLPCFSSFRPSCLLITTIYIKNNTVVGIKDKKGRKEGKGRAFGRLPSFFFSPFLLVSHNR